PIRYYRSRCSAPPDLHSFPTRRSSDLHRHEAFAFQLVERLAHRGAADRHAFGDLAFAEAVAGQQAELEDVVLELLVDALGKVLRALPAASFGTAQLHVRRPRGVRAAAGRRRE